MGTEQLSQGATLLGWPKYDVKITITCKSSPSNETLLLWEIVIVMINWYR